MPGSPQNEDRRSRRPDRSQPETIRYYESIGLIPEPRRTESGYRDYREEDFERIRFIKTARRLDLSIDEIREILAFTDRKQVPCGHVRDVLARKAREVDERITEMIQLRADSAKSKKAFLSQWVTATASARSYNTGPEPR